MPLRQFPHPYRAVLAVCSDLDETPDTRTYRRTVEFLNTTNDTAMGPGVGLEVGNSIYFDMPPGRFSYWNADDRGRAMIRALIQSGHIDCLHSYGELATTRDHARRALDELARHNCRLEVWVDHGVAPTNLDTDTMQGHGDEPGHAAYHADLTAAHGVQYVWRGRVTSIIGQDIPASLGGLWRPRHPVASARTIAKETMKRALARCGSRKYAMHGPNEVLRPVRLRDGTPVYEFLRSNPHWGGVSSCDTADGIADVLTDEMLGHLVGREGVCILYTHLGKGRDGPEPLPPSAVAAFRRLAAAQRAGQVLVTTTRRLLGYCRAVREVSVSVTKDQRGTRIDLCTRSSASPAPTALAPSDLEGLTFYVDDPESTRVMVDGREVTGLVQNAPDDTGRPSVSLPWRRLALPDL